MCEGDDCSVLNVHMHPEPVDNCHDRCCMCCGYCTPIGVAILIAGLVIASVVYYILVMKDNPDAWRIVLCIIFILITVAAGGMVFWAYYKVIFTRPGYVDRDPWKHRPVYMSPEGMLAGTEEEAGNGDPNARPDPAQQRQQPKRQPPVTDPLYPQEDSGETSSNCHNPLLGEERGGPATSQDVEVAVSMDSSSQPSQNHAREEKDVRVPVVTENEGPRRRTHSPFEPGPAQNGSSGNGNGATATTRNSPVMQQRQELQEHPQQQREGEGDGEAPANPYVVTRLDRWGNMRYCKYCRLYKPDYAYHCYACKHCVYRFDHHCPFIANCVGRNNYRLFLIFLLYGGVCCFIACVPITITIFAIDKKPIMDKIGWIAVPGVELVLTAALCGFYAEHRCLMAKGKSTVESVVRDRQREQRMRERGLNPWSKKRKEYDAAHQNSRAPEPTEEQKRLLQALEKELVDEHKRELWGTQTGWRAYLPNPLRTDDTPNGIRRV